MDWLLAPMDPARAHEVSVAVSWHARSMVLAWGVIAPLAVLIARFFKVLPGQDWPRVLDSQVWWRTHWIGHTGVVILSLVALTFVLPVNWENASLHNILGYLVLASMLVQVLFGIFRGDKGGPTAPAKDGSWRGHHYDMTPRRRLFEMAHKSLGYLTLILAAATILLGLWKANAPVWMGLSIVLWWALLLSVFVRLQRRGMAMDTYQAIWGDDPSHPGNRLPHPGWGVRRPKDSEGMNTDVRSDRGDRVRSH